MVLNDITSGSREVVDHSLFLGTTPTPERSRLGIGGASKGPMIQPVLTSLVISANMTSACTKVEERFFALLGPFGPVFPTNTPFSTA